MWGCRWKHQKEMWPPASISHPAVYSSEQEQPVVWCWSTTMRCDIHSKVKVIIDNRSISEPKAADQDLIWRLWCNKALCSNSNVQSQLVCFSWPLKSRLLQNCAGNQYLPAKNYWNTTPVIRSLTKHLSGCFHRALARTSCCSQTHCFMFIFPVMQDWAPPGNRASWAAGCCLHTS